MKVYFVVAVTKVESKRFTPIPYLVIMYTTAQRQLHLQKAEHECSLYNCYVLYNHITGGKV